MEWKNTKSYSPQTWEGRNVDPVPRLLFTLKLFLQTSGIATK